MSKGHVIIIESIASTAKLLGDFISGVGYEVTIKEDGVSGLQEIKNTVPTAVLVCAEADKMSGYAVCNRMKKNEKLEHIPVMITSEKATEETFKKYAELKHSAEAYLLKPFEIEEFNAKFEEMLAASAKKEESLDDFDSFDDIVKGMEEEEEDINLDRETSAAFDNIIDDAFSGGDINEEVDAVDSMFGDEEKTDAGFEKDLPTNIENPVSDEPSVEEAEEEVQDAADESNQVSLSESLGLEGIADEEEDGQLIKKLEEVQKERDNLKRELNDLKNSGDSSGTSKEREYLRLKREINEKERKLIDLNDDLGEKEELILEKKKKIRDLNRKTADLNGKILELEQVKVDLDEKLQKANDKISQLTEAKVQLNEDVENLNKKNNEITGQLAATNKKIEELNEENAQKLNLLQQEKEKELEVQKNEHENQNNQLKSEHDNSIQEIKSEHEQAFNNLKSEHSSTVEKLNNEHTGELINLKSEHEEAINNLKSEHEEVINNLKSEHEEAINNLKSEHEQQINELNNKHQQEKDELNGRISQLENEKSEFEEKVFNLEQVKMKNESTIDDLNSKNEGFEEKLKSSRSFIEQDRNVAHQSLNSIKEALGQLEARLHVETPQDNQEDEPIF
ncbi:MAG: response regulator [Deltaproteobacteria bacterium]|jgi:CheY-like chemotaxis protein/chromosome segregation ATPase|nr:response regulator [Deltaproteobacteria bacterium]